MSKVKRRHRKREDRGRDHSIEIDYMITLLEEIAGKLDIIIEDEDKQ